MLEVIVETLHSRTQLHRYEDHIYQSKMLQPGQPGNSPGSIFVLLVQLSNPSCWCMLYHQTKTFLGAGDVVLYELGLKLRTVPPNLIEGREWAAVISAGERVFWAYRGAKACMIDDTGWR